MTSAFRKFDDHLHECDRCCDAWMKASETDKLPGVERLCRIGRRLFIKTDHAKAPGGL